MKPRLFRPLKWLRGRGRLRRRGAIALAGTGIALLAIALVQASPPEVSPLDLELDGPGVDVDDPCFWIDPTNPAGSLLFVTAKGSGLVEVFGAPTGVPVGTVPGFLRPNNCAVEGDLLLTTDADARDVKLHHLPDLAFVRTFGADMLRPQGIDVFTTPTGQHLVYVTDSGDASVHVYDLDSGALVRAFPTGFGLAIEPVLADDLHQRIYVAREETGSGPRGIGVFTPEGILLREVGASIFASDPEGMALYACGDGGYLVAADQKASATEFEVFDRLTLEHVGTFQMQDGSGEFTDHTDGLDIAQRPLPGFPGGVLAACDGCGSALPDEMDVVAWEKVAAVLGLDVCPDGVPPDCRNVPCHRRVVATADAFVSAFTPGTNFGSERALRIDADPVEQTLLRFDVPDVGGLEIQRAVVRLTVDITSGSASTKGGTLYATDGGWAESTVTYTSRPQPLGTPIAKVAAVSEGQAVDFDVRGALHGPGQYDFVLVSGSSNGARYRSREAGVSPPALLLTLQVSTPPTVTIAAPAPGAVVLAGRPLELRGSANDAESGDVSASIRWTSDLDGPLGVGATVLVQTLRLGRHVITAEAVDDTGVSGRASVTVRVNEAPTVTIASPADGTTVTGGTSIVLSGTARDAEDGPLDGALAWTSDRDGALGAGATLAVRLSEGTHRVTAAVVDSVGTPATASVTLTVTPAPPNVHITSPVHGTAVLLGDPVTLAGTAVDPTDGDLSDRLTWRSSLQGILGTGPMLVLTGLQTGTHLLTASAVDETGLTGFATVSLRVAQPALSIEAAADAYVDADLLDQNFGPDTLLQVDASPQRQALLRFVVAGTAGLSVERALVRLTVSGVSASASDSGGTLHAMSDTGWQENTVTWRTRPPIDGPAYGTRGPVAQAEMVEFDVTPAVPGDGTLTFALVTASGDAVKYRSREGAAGRPTLVLNLRPHTNVAPTVTITGPPDGASVSEGTPVTLTATASDPEDGDLRRAISWSSSLQGALGAGPIVTASLGIGTHVIDAAVTDTGGLTGSQQVTVTVRPPMPNTPPRISIVAPLDGHTFTLPDPTSFAATADDAEDGALTARIRWTSDRDGVIGTGGSFARVLSEGAHRITASVIDAGGLPASATVTVTIVPPAVLEFAPAADTYVDAASPRTNFGTNTRLRVDRDSERIAFLRFGVTGVGTRNIIRAILRLQVDTAADSDSDVGGTLSAMTPGGWEERTVTYETRPVVDGAAVGSIGPVTLGQVVDFDVTAVVAGEGTYDFALTTTSKNVASYRAREAGAGGPRLILSLGGYAPAVSITSPPDQTVVFTDRPIDLTATASDIEDGDLAGTLTWVSSRDGVFGSGGTVSSAPLTVGTHTIGATVTDSSGRSGQAQITLRVREPDARPTVVIGAPADGTAVPAGTAVTLTATASDSEGGDLSAAIQWLSSRDGPLGTGASRTVPLTEGSHAITAMVTEPDGGVGSTEITLVVLPTPPVVGITAPADGTTVLAGASVIFRGTASDATDGDLSGVLQWTSDRDGAIGLGASFATTKLSVGTHLVTALVADSGDLVGTAERTVVVQPRNQPPELAIKAPANGAALLTGQPSVLSATATDPEDGNLGPAVRWTSSRDGVLGTGETLVLSTLSAGTHTLTASVADHAGLSVTVSVTVNLSSPVRTFSASLDTYVDAASPAQSFGSFTDLIADASPVNQAFLRFAATGIAPFAVGQARLRLTTSSANGSPSDVGGTVHSLTNNSWSNATTWNTRPPIDGPALASQGAVTTNQVVDFDVTRAVTADGTYNFALVSAASDGVHYRSRESSMGRPQLIVTRRQEIDPVVNVSAPLSGTRVSRGTLVAFSARATDAENGDLSSRIVWNSNLDGFLGTGSSINVQTLGVGTHTVTATATDDDLGQGSAAVEVTVTPGEVGFADAVYGPDVDVNLDKATAEKPESKLWYHDGTWWATLYRPEMAEYRIHRLDRVTQTWIDTGVFVDERARSRQDVLWDGQRLYMTSRFGELPPQSRLLRFKYDSKKRLFMPDRTAVRIPSGGSEAVTIAKDSTGRLWIAYTLNGQVFVSHTTDNEDHWIRPFLVPVAEGTTVASDDIAGVIALPGKIGVFWSNQLTDTFYFAVHADGAPTTAPASWSLEIVARGTKVADDHFNMKLASDGRLFVALKTGHAAAAAPHIGLVIRSTAGAWSPIHTVIDGVGTPTRPLCLLDESARRVYVFYSSSQAAVYYKTSSMDDVAFTPGIGTPFIASDSSGEINNPTGTKQNVNVATTGIVVLASGSERYWHNVIQP